MDYCSPRELITGGEISFTLEGRCRYKLTQVQIEKSAAEKLSKKEYSQGKLVKLSSRSGNTVLSVEEDENSSLHYRISGTATEKSLRAMNLFPPPFKKPYNLYCRNNR